MDYEPFDRFRAKAVEWHVNFADPHLFCAYGGDLMAQDEIQVAEHPALGSLREALLHRGIEPLTEEGGEPTPILVAGVERRCAFSAGNLYGNRFAAATAEEVERAVRRIEPPTRSNILAMAAPACGFGRYAREEIERVLATAYTGFAAVRLESERLAGAPCPAIVHTGFWGCGAFGGDRTLMVMLQAFAARLAGLAALVLHAFDEHGVATAEDALARLDREILEPGAQSTAEVIARLDAQGFEWGESDGN